MARQRITISLPEYLYQNLLRQVPAGKISHFVSKAIDKALFEQPLDPVGEFFALRKKLPKMKREKIIEAIKKGRV